MVAVTALLIHQLDSARTDGARPMLRLQLEGHILAIDALLDTFGPSGRFRIACPTTQDSVGSKPANVVTMLAS